MRKSPATQSDAGCITLFLCGDVMTGRGIDQILPHPVDPHLFEPCVRSARDYVALAEAASAPIDCPVEYAYVWGDALRELELVRPDARLVNLETAVTVSEAAWPGKDIHYRMHPANAPCLVALAVDCCVLANNHVMDWGREGLLETVATLSASGIRTAGAGGSVADASAPAVVELAGNKRILVCAFAMESSGVPSAWRARDSEPGVNMLDDLSEASVDVVARAIHPYRRHGDIIVVSLHWGPNWGFGIPAKQRHFARNLVDGAGVDLVHGHSSHHVKGIEVYRDKLILYGCGDFLNDYEGIGGYRTYRGDLALMYFPALDAESGRLRDLVMTPMCMRRLRVSYATAEQADWLYSTLNREGRRFGTAVERNSDDTFRLRWA